MCQQAAAAAADHVIFTFVPARCNSMRKSARDGLVAGIVSGTNAGAAAGDSKIGSALSAPGKPRQDCTD